MRRVRERMTRAVRVPLVQATAPVLTSFDYDLADTAGGDSITITGTDLGSASACTVGGTSATITGNTSTTLTFTMPAKTAGTYNVTVTTSGGTSNALSIEAWSPAEEALQGYWRASFAGSPWVGQASAGGSSGRNLSQASAPDVGATVNGFAPADFTPANSDRLASAIAATNFVDPSTGFMAVLFQADAATADTGASNWNAMPGLLLDTAGRIGLTFSTSGVRLGAYNGSARNSVAVAASTATWYMAIGRWSGGTLDLIVNGAAPSSFSSVISMTTNVLQMGANATTTTFFDGRILAAMTGQYSPSNAICTKILKWARARFRLALT